MNNLKAGDIVKASVSNIFKTHIIVDLKDGWTGLLHVSKISDYFVPKINSMFKIGEKYYFEVIEVEEENKRVKLSWKSIMPRFVKDPFEFGLEETSNGFTNLKKNVEKEVENA